MFAVEQEQGLKWFAAYFLEVGKFELGVESKRRAMSANRKHPSMGGSSIKTRLL